VGRVGRNSGEQWDRDWPAAKGAMLKKVVSLIGIRKKDLAWVVGTNR